MATIAQMIAKPSLEEGLNDLTLIQATHRASDGRIEILFGDKDMDGLASISTMPPELNWILPIWFTKMPDLVIDINEDFPETEEGESSKRQVIADAIHALKGEVFSIVVEEADVPPRNGKKLFNGTFS